MIRGCRRDVTHVLAAVISVACSQSPGTSTSGNKKRWNWRIKKELTRNGRKEGREREREVTHGRICEIIGRKIM
jgi:hypothetical protein